MEDESFDGILFDTFPLSKEENGRNHFFFSREAFRLLRKGAVLTYYSDESKSFSSEHLKQLKNAGFRHINFRLCNVRPPKNCLYWNRRTILAPIIIK